MDKAKEGSPKLGLFINFLNHLSALQVEGKSCLSEGDVYLSNVLDLNKTKSVGCPSVKLACGYRIGRFVDAGGTLGRRWSGRWRGPRETLGLGMLVGRWWVTGQSLRDAGRLKDH